MTLLRNIWHEIKWVWILKMELGMRKKKSFFAFGKESVMQCPLKQLSGAEKIAIGDHTTVLKNSRMAVYQPEKSHGAVIQIGNGCYIGYDFTVLATGCGTVTIGDHVLIASDVVITSENHGIDPESEIPYMDQELSENAVVIGEGCWIGEKTIILPGVTIGEKAVIGAGSVVTKSVPPLSIAVGNPARVIKRYNQETHQWEQVKNGAE